MSKVSKSTASTHHSFPGYVDAYEQEIGGWTVSMETNFTDMDEALFFKGAPNDQCQANHLGYVLKGKFGVRKATGRRRSSRPVMRSSSSPGTRRSCSPGVSLWPSPPRKRRRCKALS